MCITHWDHPMLHPDAVHIIPSLGWRAGGSSRWFPLLFLCSVCSLWLVVILFKTWASSGSGCCSFSYRWWMVDPALHQPHCSSWLWMVDPPLNYLSTTIFYRKSLVMFSPLEPPATTSSNWASLEGVAWEDTGRTLPSRWWLPLILVMIAINTGNNRLNWWFIVG